jgi:hypothetical protein
VRLTAISPREASIFACVTDTIVAPEPALPPVHETDAALFFDRWLERSPWPNRLGLRALFLVAELSPWLLGARARLRQLAEPGRASALERVEGSKHADVRRLAQLVKGIVCLCYYGDDRVMLTLGYDATANARRGQELRAREGRP